MTIESGGTWQQGDRENLLGLLVPDLGRLGIHNRRAGPVKTVNVNSMDPERAKVLLAAERARIVRALAQLGHADTGELSDQDDAADRASDTYQDELDEGRSDDLRRELHAVERAEKRLAAGTYGLSVVSGKPIPDERLEAVPTAERTAEEEARRT